MSKEIEQGMEFVKQFANLNINDIDSVDVERGKKYVDIISKTWMKRRKSNLVKWMMKETKTSLDTVAEYLACSKQYLNNKLNRDSFSFDDLIIVAYACGFTFTLSRTDDKRIYVRQIDAVEHFKGYDNETLERITRLKKGIKDSRREEYEQKKAELEQMRIKYGFKD